MALITMTTLNSCAAPEPPGATYNRHDDHDEYDSMFVLGPDGNAAALAAMRAAVPGEGTTLAPARYGVRWTDVQDAVRWGSNIAEMAVLTTTRVSDECWEFKILTVADEPATLWVTHVAPPTVVELRAVAGIFENRRDLEQRLLREVNLALRQFGEKPQPVSRDEVDVAASAGESK